MGKQYLTPEESKQFGDDIREAFYQWHLTNYKAKGKLDLVTLELIKRNIKRTRTLKSFSLFFAELLNEFPQIKDSFGWRQRLGEHWEQYRFLLMAEVCISKSVFYAKLNDIKRLEQALNNPSTNASY